MSLVDKLKKFFIFKTLYKLPGIARFYHFLLAFLGAVRYGFPSRKLFVIGVTGTKGKTTALEVLDSVLNNSGARTALLSSLYIKIGKEREKNLTDNTMPGRFFIQAFLRRAKRAGCKYALVEVTSQGVVLSRHRFINWKLAGILNLSPEHIEAHGSFEEYRDAKASFLEYAASQGATVFINEDMKEADYFAGKAKKENVRFFSARREKETLSSLDNRLYLLSSSFNRENLAFSISVARYFGIKESVILETVRNFSGVPGRMEFIQKSPFSVVVDYAHTPDSLGKVYETVKNDKRKLICVLGSAGGGRDKRKRPEMGRIAGNYCDRIILTDEDPYDEDPREILREVSRDIPESKFEIVLNRSEAIKKAISLAGPGDVVVVTGKGSEPYIHAKGGKKIPWSDTRAALEALGRKSPGT